MSDRSDVVLSGAAMDATSAPLPDATGTPTSDVLALRQHQNGGQGEPEYLQRARQVLADCDLSDYDLTEMASFAAAVDGEDLEYALEEYSPRLESRGLQRLSEAEARAVWQRYWPAARAWIQVHFDESTELLNDHVDEATYRLAGLAAAELVLEALPSAAAEHGVLITQVSLNGEDARLDFPTTAQRKRFDDLTGADEADWDVSDDPRWRYVPWWLRPGAPRYSTFVPLSDLPTVLDRLRMSTGQNSQN